MDFSLFGFIGVVVIVACAVCAVVIKMRGYSSEDTFEIVGKTLVATFTTVALALAIEHSYPILSMCFVGVVGFLALVYWVIDHYKGKIFKVNREKP